MQIAYCSIFKASNLFYTQLLYSSVLGQYLIEFVTTVPSSNFFVFIERKVCYNQQYINPYTILPIPWPQELIVKIVARINYKTVQRLSAVSVVVEKRLLSGTPFIPYNNLIVFLLVSSQGLYLPILVNISQESSKGFTHSAHFWLVSTI